MSSLTDNQFRIIVALLAIGLAVIIIRLRFCYEPALPDKPPRPKIDLEVVADESRKSETVYQTYLQKDAHAADLAAPSVAEMSKRLPHRADDSGWRLAPGDPPMEVAGLRLRVLVQKPEVARHPTLALEIENLTDTHVAYRIDTRPTRGTRSCARREALPYNALTLAPGEAIVRGECIYRRGWALAIERVETVSLPPLGYSYVSRVPPVATNLDPRLQRDHRAPGGAMCKAAVPQAVISSLENGITAWRDVIDFFARHRCETYKFPLGYKAFGKDGEHRLPVVPE